MPVLSSVVLASGTSLPSCERPRADSRENQLYAAELKPVVRAAVTRITMRSFSDSAFHDSKCYICTILVH